MVPSGAPAALDTEKDTVDEAESQYEALPEALPTLRGLPERITEDARSALKDLQTRLIAFQLKYQFALDQLETKINILREEFEHTHEYSPIEHVRTRLKSMDSLLAKIERTGCPRDLESVAERIRDIAGVRITCSFVADAYWIADMLTSQPDVTVVEVKDYIVEPKPNGYQSLHVIVQVPVYLSDRTEQVYVEVQIRTIAMDFWASLEHKIYYKYEGEIPARLREELRQAALVADHLDRTMARLHDEVSHLDGRRDVVRHQRHRDD